MSQITFFRQARRDGGVRTGVELNGDFVLHRFVEGAPDDDPSLLSFVDICFEKPGAPDDVEGARRWLLTRTNEVSSALLRLADDLDAGVDTGPYPLHRALDPAPDGTAMTIACSAIRRLDARRIAQTLKELAAGWEQRLRELEPQAQVVL